MKNTKKVLLFVTIPFLLVLFFRGSLFRFGLTKSLQEIDDQNPPTVNGIWVQKLLTPLPDSNNLIMMVSYEDDGVVLPDRLEIYHDETNFTYFWDDGTGPDPVANDRIYSAYLKEDLDAFTDEIGTLEDWVKKNDGVLHFRGHVGQYINAKDMAGFDFTGFNNGDVVPLNLYLLDATECDDELLKQNSLFITDLAVVEDPGRTFNAVNRTGNPYGAWTFGHMVRNIANENVTDTSAKVLLKEWLKGWMDGRIINGQSVAPRDFAFRYFIGPWVQKARELGPNPLGNVYYDQNASHSDWEYEWDQTPEDSLLKYAPFKLMAIVNRIDLRGNFGYAPSLSNAGETRFIFTLINPLADTLHTLGTDTPPGMPPMGMDGASGGFGATNSFIDWRGMNLIIEYGNPHRSACKLRDFARQWLDLSALPLGSSAFNDSLEVITLQVTEANLVPSKPNGSALNQIRTNEKLFFPSLPGGVGFSSWEDANWQLSEFKLDKKTHLLKPVPVFGTPTNDVNAQTNLDFGGSPGIFGTSGTPNHEGTGMSANAIAVIDWVYKRKAAVLRGNFKLPDTYTYGSYTFTQAAVAEMDAEFLHYWDLYWTANSTTYYTQLVNPVTSAFQNIENQEAKNLRQQFSLNTCQGCHGAETKTMFTQVRPVGYGQAINYWAANPADDVGNLDIRTPYSSPFVNQSGNFAPANLGVSVVNDSAGLPIYNYVNSVYTNFTNAHFPRLSGFLTGRAFTGSGTDTTWQDDWVNSADDGKDRIWDGDNQLFYVYDPSNRWEGGRNVYLGPDQVLGYNDLQMRKQGLCKFVNSKCHLTEGILPIARDLTHNIMPAEGH